MAGTDIRGDGSSDMVIGDCTGSVVSLSRGVISWYPLGPGMALDCWW